MSWVNVLLGEVADTVDYGVTASSSPLDIGPKFLRITDIQDGQVNWDTVPWCDCKPKEMASSKLVPGDIVFARTGATTGKSFLIRECPSNSVFASYLIRVRFQDCVDPSYINHFFQSEDYWSQINQSARGAAQPGVNASVLKTLKIPLPPLPEQRRIAEVLDRVEELRAKRRESIASLDHLNQVIFLEMFGDPGVNPFNFPVRKIRDLLQSASYGTSEKSLTTGTYPVLRMNNITRTGEMDFTDLKYMEIDACDLERYLVKPGDVLFNRTNSAELVGKTGIFRDSRPMAFAGYLIRLRVNKENDSEYLGRFLNSAYAKRMLRGMCKSIIGMANINATEIQNMDIAQPPLKLQQEFARRIGAVEKLKATHRASLAQLDALFASLQHRAFRGEL